MVGAQQSVPLARRAHLAPIVDLSMCAVSARRFPEGGAPRRRIQPSINETRMSGLCAQVDK